MTPIEAIEAIELQGADHDIIMEAWQYLIDTGIVWQLQGWYGRHAMCLIKDGECTPSIPTGFSPPSITPPPHP